MTRPLVVACSPNSNPEQWSQVKRLIIGTAVIGGLSAAGRTWLLMAARPWTATIVGSAPAAIVLGLIAIYMVMAIFGG